MVKITYGLNCKRKRIDIFNLRGRKWWNSGGGLNYRDSKSVCHSYGEGNEQNVNLKWLKMWLAKTVACN